MPERTIYLFRVDKVEQRTKSVYVSGLGKDATFVDRPLGWFIVCGGTTFGVGETKPDLAPGDTLELRKREPTT